MSRPPITYGFALAVFGEPSLFLYVTRAGVEAGEVEFAIQGTGTALWESRADAEAWCERFCPGRKTPGGRWVLVVELNLAKLTDKARERTGIPKRGITPAPAVAAPKPPPAPEPARPARAVQGSLFDATGGDG